MDRGYWKHKPMKIRVILTGRDYHTAASVPEELVLRRLAPAPVRPRGLEVRRRAEEEGWQEFRALDANFLVVAAP